MKNQFDFKIRRPITFDAIEHILRENVITSSTGEPVLAKYLDPYEGYWLIKILYDVMRENERLRKALYDIESLADGEIEDIALAALQQNKYPDNA